MRISDRIYRELLLRALEDEFVTTQRELSKKTGASLASVNKVVKELARLGGVTIRPLCLKITNPSRIQFVWNTRRQVYRDFTHTYSVRSSLVADEVRLPEGFVVTSYLGWKKLTRREPFKNNLLHVYVEEKRASIVKPWIREWGMLEGGEEETPLAPNVFVMATDDAHLFEHSPNGIAPVPQLLADIYSSPEFFKTEFIEDICTQFPKLRGV